MEIEVTILHERVFPRDLYTITVQILAEREYDELINIILDIRMK